MIQLSHPNVTTGKSIALTRWTVVDKVMSLLFNMLSRFVIAFLLRNRHLLISWWQAPSAVILEPKKRKSVTVSIFSPSVCHELMRLVATILVFWLLNFKPAFSLFFSHSSRSSVVPFCFLPLDWNHLHIWGCWYFSWQFWFQLMSYPAWHFAWCTLHRGEGSSNPLQYSCPENPMDRVSRWATVHRVQRIKHDWVCAHTHIHVHCV